MRAHLRQTPSLIPQADTRDFEPGPPAGLGSPDFGVQLGADCSSICQGWISRLAAGTPAVRMEPGLANGTLVP